MRSDSELLHRFLDQDDQAAFSELVSRHANLVYSVGLHHGRSPHRAEEVVQRVFIDLSRKARSLAGRADLAGWLYTAARYSAIKLVRGEARREGWERKSGEEGEDVVSPFEAEGFDPAAMEGGLSKLVVEELAELGERDRSALLLRYWENRSWDEIGRRLSMSAEAARKRVERALERLRQRLKGKGAASTSPVIAAALAQSAVAAPAGVAVEILRATSLAGVAGGAAAGSGALFPMATSKLGLSVIAVMLAASLGAALYEFREVGRLNRRFDVVERERVAASLALARAKGRTGEASKRLATLALATHPMAMRPSAIAMNVTIEWLRSNPQTLAMAKEIQRRRFEAQYAKLFEELSLASGARDRFIEILTDHASLFIDQFAIKNSGPIDRIQTEQELQDLLGDSGMTVYHAYEERRRTDTSGMASQEMQLLLAGDPSLGSKAAAILPLLNAANASAHAKQEAENAGKVVFQPCQLGAVLEMVTPTIAPLLSADENEAFRLAVEARYAWEKQTP